MVVKDSADESVPSPDALREAALEAIGIDPALPQPGEGKTLQRWQTLAGIAREDVCLAKILEAHYDAIAILRELDQPDPTPHQLWAVWAAEVPSAQSTLSRDGGTLRLDGSKAWCSGAGLVDRALLTAHEGAEKRLVSLDLAQAGISAPASTWPAVGMSRVVSAALHFSDVPVHEIGDPGAYLGRPGFWHGGAGIAACWFGAAAAIAERLRTSPHPSEHALSLLGRVDMDLSAAAALLRELAHAIDADPLQPHIRQVIRVRSVVERIAVSTIDRVGRALGPGPLCTDPAHASRCADLVVFIRQSHAERDWEQLGRAAREGSGWTLASA